MKAYASKDGVIRTGVEWLASDIKVSDLLAIPAGEASGKGILLADVRQPVVLTDIIDADGNAMTFNVTVRVERAPRNQQEADLVSRKRSLTQQNADKREEKERNSRREVFSAITETAVKAAKASTSDDPIANAVKAKVAEMFGGHKSLNP